MRPDDLLSAAVLTLVGASAIPGRHPERIADPGLRARVVALVAEVDDQRPGEDLTAWAQTRRRELADSHPELSAQAANALCSLFTFEWR